MPDDYYDDEQDDQQQENADIKALRQAAKERNDLQKQLAASQRELAFAKSGLDFSDPKLKYFINGYEGDLTPDAIRQQAEADGFIAPAQNTKPTDQADINAHQRMQNASAGANDTPPPDLAEKLRQANSQEEVMKLVVESGLPTSWNRPE
jgi:hypothetical protein